MTLTRVVIPAFAFPVWQIKHEIISKIWRNASPFFTPFIIRAPLLVLAKFWVRRQDGEQHYNFRAQFLFNPISQRVPKLIFHSQYREETEQH